MFFLGSLVVISLIHLFVASLQKKDSVRYMVNICDASLVVIWLVLLFFGDFYEKNIREQFLWGSGFLGVNTFFTLFWIFFQKNSEKRFATTEKAILIIGIITSVYIVYATTDSWLYFRGEPINFRISQSHHLYDTSCDTVVFFKKEAENGAYRCPKSYDIPTKIMLGNFINSFPLLPWPEYIEGHSDQLKDEVKKIKAR